MESDNALPPSSSLEPLQTNPQRQHAAHISHTEWGNPEFGVEGITPEESEFRHSGWAVIRHRVYQALQRCHVGEHRVSRFANCGSGAWLYRSRDVQDLAIRCNKCGDRFCVACGRERSSTITNALCTLMAGKDCRFTTLTLRHSPTPLADQISRLYRSFTALRRREFWKSAVDGGAAFLEVKIGRDGLWHVHLHAIVEGRYLDQRQLSREWHAVTGDSSIVDVRSITDYETRASYVTKYVTKPADSTVYHVPEKLDELVCSMRGRRLCTTFGTWRGTELEPTEETGVEWVAVGRLDTLKSNAAAGDPEAVRWIEAAARKWPLFASFLRPPDPDP